MTNLVDIAATIRKHSPGALPESFREHCGRLCGCFPCREPSGITSAVYSPLPDDIAEAVLIAAMVQDANLHRMPTSWLDARVGGSHCFDSAHGGSLGACYRAWCWAKGITCDTHPSA